MPTCKYLLRFTLGQNLDVFLYPIPLMHFRKIILTCLFSLFTLGLSAQSILNAGFENNVIVGNDTTLEHWSMDAIGAEISDYAHSGNQAIAIWNWYFYVKGWATYGDAQNAQQDGGHPVSINPDKLSGWYQYTYGENAGASDSAICQVYLYSYQNFAGTRDTIASGSLKFGPTTSYEAFDVPLIYTSPGIIADTIVIKFTSSENGFCANVSDGNCLYLYIDDLEISTATGITQSLDGEIGAKVYPSPSHNGFRVLVNETTDFPLKMELFDLGGKLLATEIVKNEAKVIGESLPTGHYIWRMHTANGKIQSGRITIH